MRDLHTHLGGAVPAAVLWETLCETGLQTDFATFDQLQDYLTVKPELVRSLDDFLNGYFSATELIQSSPHAIEVNAYQAIAKAYRRAKVNAIELRFNPYKRLRRGVHNLDAIIMATIQGLQRASMHYNVQTGIILVMGKELSFENNTQIVDAAIRFIGSGALGGAHGVVGIDMAGPESIGRDNDIEWLKQASGLVDKARNAGLHVTWHVGETAHSGPKGMENVLEWIRPERIGHGIELRRAVGEQRARLIKRLNEQQVCLEVCPTVNIVTHSIDSVDEIAQLVRVMCREGVAFCLNTDNPYLIHTNIQREYAVVAQALEEDANLLDIAHQHATKHSFL